MHLDARCKWMHGFAMHLDARCTPTQPMLHLLSKPGPEDLCASYPLGVCSVVVVSPSFRGVSCSVPRFPLLKKAFFRTQTLGLPRLS